MDKAYNQQWHSCSCFVQGEMHVRLDLVCQDYARACEVNGIQILALSDGCGSSEISQIGSKMTVDFMIDFVSKEFDRLYSSTEAEAKNEILNSLINCYKDYLIANPKVPENYAKEFKESSLVIDALEKYGSNRSQAMKILGFQLLDSTVLMVAVKDDKRLTVHIGDGYIFGVKNHKLMLLHEENKDSSLPANATVYPFDIFTNMATMDNFYFSKSRDANEISLIVLSSDGLDALLEMPNPDDPKTYGKKFVNKNFIEEIALLALEENGSELLEKRISELKTIKDGSFRLSSNADDCSLAVLCKENLDVLCSVPTKIGDGEADLTPRIYYPGKKLVALAKGEAAPCVSDLMLYYLDEDPEVIISVAKLLDSKDGETPALEISDEEMRLARNAIHEFDLEEWCDA